MGQIMVKAVARPYLSLKQRQLMMGQERSDGRSVREERNSVKPSRGGPFNTRDRMGNKHTNSGALGNAAVCFCGPSNSRLRLPSEAFAAEQSGKLILDYPVTLADRVVVIGLNCPPSLTLNLLQNSKNAGSANYLTDETNSSQSWRRSPLRGCIRVRSNRPLSIS